MRLSACRLAESQPHAAFAVFTHGLSSTWTFVQRVLEADDSLFAPMEEIIQQRLLPALTGQSALGDATRDLLALPARLGGLGVRNPVSTAPHEYSTSCKVMAALTGALLAGISHGVDGNNAAKSAKLAQAATR